MALKTHSFHLVAMIFVAVIFAREQVELPVLGLVCELPAYCDLWFRLWYGLAYHCGFELSYDGLRTDACGGSMLA